MYVTLQEDKELRKKMAQNRVETVKRATPQLRSRNIVVNLRFKHYNLFFYRREWPVVENGILIGVFTPSDGIFCPNKNFLSVDIN